MNPSDQSNQKRWFATFLVIVGFVVACVALIAPSIGKTGYWAVSPFGWRRVIVVHLLAALPLAWLLTYPIAGQINRLYHRGAILTALVFGVGLAWFSGAVASTLIADAIHQSSFTERHTLRLGWSVALLCPWCLASQLVLAGDTSAQEKKSGRLVNAMLALAVAIALPGIFVYRIIGQETRELGRLVLNNRFPESHRIAYGLYSLGSKKPIEFPLEESVPQLPAELLVNLNGGIQAAKQKAQQLSSLLEQSAPTLAAEQLIATRLELAAMLRILERGPEALEVLGDLAQQMPAAALLASHIEGDLRNHRAAAKSSQLALDLLNGQNPPPPDQSPNLARDAYHTLAVALRRSGRYDESENVLREAIERLPDDRAHFHLELGRHYEMSGRAPAAVSELEKAITLDPSQTAEAEAIIRRMRNNSPICLFPTSRYTDR